MPICSRIITELQRNASFRYNRNRKLQLIAQNLLQF